jgi:hypothetical protein
MNKEQQKQLITEIMDLDAKDGLYDTVNDTVKKLAEESWEGCDGCDENDKYFFMKGFQTGYNRAKPDELSHELRYKDGTPMRKYNSPKLQAIEMEISDEEIEKSAFDYVENSEEDKWTATLTFMAGAKWYREQLKKRE